MGETKKRGQYRHHTEAFKLQVVNEFKSGKKAKDVATAYSIPVYYIYVWKKALDSKLTTQNPTEEATS